MVLLDIDQFLLRMGRLYKDKKAGGSVWVTFKRSAPPAPSPPPRSSRRSSGLRSRAAFLLGCPDRSARARSIAGPEGAEGAEASEGAVGGGRRSVPGARHRRQGEALLRDQREGPHQVPDRLQRHAQARAGRPQKAARPGPRLPPRRATAPPRRAPRSAPAPSPERSRLLCEPAGIGREKRSSRAATEK